jgi:hypothetical protein
VVGILAALWAALIGFAVAAVPLLVAWMASPDSGLTWTQSLRIAGLLWVLAHGAPIALSGITYSLLPWGLAVIPLVLLGYGGGWAARRARVGDLREVLLLVVPGAAVYAGVVAAAAAATSEPASRISAGPAAAGALVMALLGLGWGAVRAAGLGPRLHIAPMITVMVRAGLAAAATLVGFGALAATASLVVHIDDAITMSQALGAGLGGGLVLLALGVAFVPVMVAWGTAYVMGAGVVIGPGITVSPFIAVTTPAQLPPFPLLAALPQEATPMAWLLPVLGVVGGVVAGVLIARRAREEVRLVRLALAAGSAVVAGGVLGLGALLASGSLGDQRLAHLGPDALTVAILGAVLTVLGAAPSAIVPASPARPVLAVANDSDGPPATGSVDDDPS